jgi:hypothetical protein
MQYLHIISAIVIQAWHLEVNTIILLVKVVSISLAKISKTYVKNVSELFE